MALVRDAVLRVMKDRTTPVCATCISRTLDTTFQRVFDALLDIELRKDFPIRAGACGECGGHHQVIWPHRTSGQRSQDPGG
jgi:hypothetical protein